jgi:hypothetical protein
LTPTPDAPDTDWQATVHARSVHERFDWSEDELVHYQRSGGTITRWGDVTGNGTASGSATSYDSYMPGGETAETGSSPYYYKHTHGSSGTADESHDYYLATPAWSRHTGRPSTSTRPAGRRRGPTCFRTRATTRT